MLKASALYIVIIIALVIGLICSALITAAYYYRLEYEKKFRYDQLFLNLNSAVNIIMAGGDELYTQEQKFSLFSGNADTISLKRISWGVYDVAIAKSFIQRDTLYKIFSIANPIDSSKWSALYLIDADRPVALSGKTTIRGDVYIPKAGVQTAYIDNKAYEGDKRLIIGKRHKSERQLPALDSTRLKSLEHFLDKIIVRDSSFSKVDSISNSFLKPVRVFDFKKKVQTIANMQIQGNVILNSDTTLIIDSTARLTNVIAFAKNIIVKSGFHGNCQLFAADSIHVESNCIFNYPSCLGVLRFQTKLKSQEKIVIGHDANISGTVFLYEKDDNVLKPLVVLEKKVKLNGQIYSNGIVQLGEQSEIDGSIFTTRFLYKNSFTIYENYLINTTIDSKALSRYYLSSDLIPVVGKKKKILQWLEAN